MNGGSFRTDDQIRKAIERHSQLVYALAYSRARNAADAEDLFQEVFLRYAQRREPFQSDEHERAWLIRVTSNLSINLIASAWRRRVVLREEVSGARGASPRSNGALDEALDRLPEKYRAVVHLYYYEDMTTDEIAEALGEKSATVRKRLTRGRETLRALLRGSGETEASGHAQRRL